MLGEGGGKKLISSALNNYEPDQIEYYGFDIFQENPPKRDEEIRVMESKEMEEVRKYLADTGADINLFAGNTRETLPRYIEDLPKMGFVYIDGGHSYETVKSDWNYVQKIINKNSTVVFDDYNLDGPRKVVDNLDRDRFTVEIIPSTAIGNVSMAKVWIRGDT